MKYVKGRLMNNKGIVKYIEHYMHKDISKGAVMLTGSWGIGKSHFIQNELIPEIQKDEDKKCVCVSLYGLKTISEISKSIYFELRTKKFKKDSEAVTAGIMAAKTVFRGVTSFFGVDLKASDDEMKELYESIDLKNKLIILEDIERCQIGILDLLGYVNSLVEQDGIKVLLVSNENEFLKYENVEAEEINSTTKKKEKIMLRRPTEETTQYLRVKEKTVNDTILYEGDFVKAIKAIIKNYKNRYLNKFLMKPAVENIYSIMRLCSCFNLRSFIYACQKTVDIYDEIPKKYLKNEDFLQAIFYGNIFFILRIKSGKQLMWGKETLFSIDLGSNVTPLFKFCYDYIAKQIMDFSKLDETYNAFIEKNTYDKHKSNGDKDIEIICNYHIHSESEVKSAVKNITERLSNPDDISFYMYGTIAVYLILIKHYLQVDIENAKERLVSNLIGRGNKLQLEYIFRTVMGDDNSEDIINEYQTLRKEMSNALRQGMLDIPNFDYLPEQIELFGDYVRKNEGHFHINEAFARDLDIDKMADMFSMCSLKQKDDIRGIFWKVYRTSNIGQFLGADLDNIQKLKSLIQEKSEKCTGDKVEKLQYKYFINNLSSIEDKLSIR